MSERERVLARLGKILSRTMSANVHEADTARRMADELMARHGLTEADLKRHADAGYHELSLGHAGFGTSWKFTLVTAAARYWGCEAVALQSGRRRRVRLVGERAAVERAAIFFEDLLRLLRDLERSMGTSLAELDGSPRECADSFRRGAVASIVTKLISLRPGRFGRQVHEGHRPGSRGHDPWAGPVTLHEPPWNPKSRRSKGTEDSSSAGGGGSPENRGIWTTIKTLVLGDKRTEHAEKIRQKYSPRMKLIDLEEAPSLIWYWIGYDEADRLVTIRDDDDRKDG